MTTEELKEAIPMRQLVESYGVKVKRDGMCCCPIHGERNASMKVYKDSFNCFACGANGDIFTFVQLMDKCDFKTAFYSLGGSYQRTTEREKAIAKIKRDKARAAREQAEKQRADLKNQMISSFDRIKEVKETYKPYLKDGEVIIPDVLVMANNFYPILCDYWESFTNNKEIDVVNVYRKCQQFDKGIDSFRRNVS